MKEKLEVSVKCHKIIDLPETKEFSIVKYR